MLPPPIPTPLSAAGIGSTVLVTARPPCPTHPCCAQCSFGSTQLVSGVTQVCSQHEDHRDVTVQLDSLGKSSCRYPVIGCYRCEVGGAIFQSCIWQDNFRSINFSVPKKAEGRRCLHQAINAKFQQRCRTWITMLSCPWSVALMESLPCAARTKYIN